jgi:hypothetical protein
MKNMFQKSFPIVMLYKNKLVNKLNVNYYQHVKKKKENKTPRAAILKNNGHLENNNIHLEKKIIFTLKY